MNKTFIAAAIIVFSGHVTQSMAGVSIGGTRFIYHEKAKGVKVELRNTSQSAWLINTTVSSGGTWSGVTPSTQPAPFIATPPLFSLKPGRENSIRLLKTHANMPPDRESLFTLSIAAIPSGQAQANSVQIAVRSRMKLFYRPANLKGNPQEAYKQLRWEKSRGQARVSNPTPFYVTLVNLVVNGKKIDNPGMVAPFSTRSINGCATVNTCHLSWQSINDYGRILEKTERDISRK